MRSMQPRRKFHDLEHARVHLAALKELFLSASAPDARTARRISALCNAAHAVLRDPYCSLKLAAVVECAGLWLGRRRGERADPYLEQLLDLLDLLQSRVLAIEAIRRASDASITQ
jgi:hypothetical protein